MKRNLHKIESRQQGGNELLSPVWLEIKVARGPSGLKGIKGKVHHSSTMRARTRGRRIRLGWRTASVAFAVTCKNCKDLNEVQLDCSEGTKDKDKGAFLSGERVCSWTVNVNERSRS